MPPSTAPGDRVAFRLNGREIAVAADLPATTTLLHWLRAQDGLCGTKEGCAEGDCGACTIVIEEPDGGRTPINACLVTLGQLHGAALRTIEGLRDATGAPHPLQHAFAETHASQCGFCTPGFVMAAWAFARERGNVHDALAGNLCRCTGYRPILDAMPAPEQPEPAPRAAPRPATFTAESTIFHRPTDLDALLALRAAHPDAWLLAGGTDLGLAFAEGGAAPRSVIALLGVPALQRIETLPDGLRVGAAAPYRHLMRAIEAAPQLGFAALLPYLGRLGSRQIRGLGTLGGNLATASPIGDMLPPLLALGATVRLRHSAGARDMPVAAFLIGYRQHALAADEIIESILLPRVPDGALFACEKLSKRHDQDISTVAAGFLIEHDGDQVRRAALAFGGMGPTAARASRSEAALVGQPWSLPSLERAARSLADDFTPVSDLRGTARYREQAAAGLLRRLWWRAAGETVDVHAVEPV